MAIGLRRKVRLDSRRDNQKITRRKNGAVKAKERARREARVLAKAKAGIRTPEVDSFLSATLGKAPKNITAEDIAAIA